MKKISLFNFEIRMSTDQKANWPRTLSMALIMMLGLLRLGSSFAAEAKPGWQAEWKKTVAAAKKEGRVNLYSTTPPRLIAEARVFQKAYPGIKVVTGSTGFGLAFQRLMAERRAGRYLADLYIAGATSPLRLHRAKALDPIKPVLVLPEVLDESKWLGGKHKYNDREQEYVFIYTGNPQIGSIGYNTNLVNIKEIKSFWDFLQPKWKGKIEARDIRTPGTGSLNLIFFYHNPALGPKYLRRLYGEMDLKLYSNIRQGVDWLAGGKYAFCFFCSSRRILPAQEQGLPVAPLSHILKEGAAITSHAGAMALVNKAPHPNAAKVFINWILTREGQLTSQRTSQVNSRRVDIPKDMVLPHYRLRKEVNYMEVETPELNNLRPVLKIIREETRKAKRNQ